MAIFKGSGKKRMLILGISRTLRFRENRICEITVKNFFDRPDLLVIEGYATLLENDQVLLFHFKMFVITVTCLESSTINRVVVELNVLKVKRLPTGLVTIT